LRKLEQIVGALNDRVPRRDFVAQAVGLAQNLLGGALIAPEVGSCSLGVELLDARLLRG
jgi:hypothetical protein